MVFAERIFDNLQSEFFAALESCRQRPGKKAVHRLRTSARRLEALMEAAKRRQPGDAKFARRIERGLKALKPVRSAAGLVRDEDVQQELLAGLVDSGVAGQEGGALEGETHRVQLELKHRRKEAAAEFEAVIREVTEEELEWISSLRTTLNGLQSKPLLKDARAIIRSSQRKLDLTDPENLHKYRKRAKFARYLAEMEGSADADRFAKRVKKVLDAIGGWHDWMLLSRFAKETLGRTSVLAVVLKKERDRALRRAVRMLGGLR